MADRVTILTVSSQHSFSGTVENRGLRVLDVLNDVSSDYLELHDVAVRRGTHGKCIKQLPQATIPKSAIDFVLLEFDRHEAPLRRGHAFVPKETRQVLVVVGDYEILGTFMPKGSFDTLRGLRQEPTAFFPVVAPKLSRVTNADAPILATVALINGLKVSLLHVDRKTVNSVTECDGKYN
jgi:hypothetical protein